ncbi:hypothetical protein CCZ01_05320 [Helicobacter monodelphidis]|uniref:EamA family transporter n=1 Tax=Helicobacter sp. 15-1451 TaxID=2004995 RepID=UPI000DCF1079|nr:EamA family transporter [Helicobacter sp. 15-1451]RAX57706.1 hypothetical protein CCZ01_05320 [Helicobacter sp. 15-1451]
MAYLVIVSIIWAFSFPLIGHYLAGSVDNYFSILVRFGLAFLVFAPLINWKICGALKLKLIGIGAIQIGIMYICYYQSFLYLSVSEVALFTIFTPFYVTLIYDICSKHFRAWYLLSIFIAVLGAYIIKYGSINSHFLIGFLLIQVANLCFGAGQSLYKFVIENESNIKQSECFGYFYLGALMVGAFSFLFFGNGENLPTTAIQWGILFYLGIIASGLSYFLWNRGACLVDSGILAIMNNVLIPLAILINFLFFGRDIENSIQFAIGSVFIATSLLLHLKLMKRYH